MGLVTNIGIFLMMLTVASGTAVASTGARPAEPGTGAKNSGTCDPCAGPIQRDAALVVVTTLAEGGYVAVWQSTVDGRVYGQCYTRAGLARGAQFRIDVDARNGILPVMVPQEDGGFVAWWRQDEQRFEQHFSGQCVPLENATLRK